MPIVWTASQGVIQRPSPGSNFVCFNSPIFRFLLVSAISARSVSRVFLDWFRTRSLDKGPSAPLSVHYYAIRWQENLSGVFTLR